MYTMGPAEIQIIINHLRIAERSAVGLDIPKLQGLNDIEWRIGCVLNHILKASISPIQIDPQPRDGHDPASIAWPGHVP